MSQFLSGSATAATEPTTQSGTANAGYVDAMTAKNPHEDLEAYFTMNEVGLGVARNNSVTGGDLDFDLDANLGGVDTPGKVGNAVRLVAASNQYLSSNGGLILPDGGSLTLCGWVRLTTNPGATTPFGLTIFGPTDALSFPTFEARVIRSASNNFLQAVFRTNASGSAGVQVNHTTNLATGTWYFWAVVLDIPNQEIRLTIDGTTTTTATTMTKTFGMTGGLKVGITADAYPVGTITTFLDGDIDELLWARRPLTFAELQAIRRNGNGTGYLQAPDTGQGAVVPFGFLSSGATVANTTTETNVVGTVTTGSDTIPANAMAFNTNAQVDVVGTITTIGAPGTLTIRWKWGGTTILTHTFTPTGSQSGARFKIVFGHICAIAGASGTAVVQSQLVSGSFTTGEAVAGSTTATHDTTVSKQFTVTVQWATADAGNSLAIQALQGSFGGR